MAIVKLQNQRINADNTYTLSEGKGNASTLCVSGTFGSATVKAGYLNLLGNFITFKDDTEADITFTADFQIVQAGGIGMKYALDVSGGTGTAILVEQFQHGR